MLLRNLFEAANNEVAIIFGRFNPPHKGHRAAWEMASQSSAWFVGTNESTVGPKDPLPFEVKVEAMKTVWPEVAGHIMPETSWLTMASEIYKKYPKATLLCLTDEDWVTKTIVQYNGKEGAHGFYNFPRIEQKATPRLSSATALRDAVAKGDREAFSQAAGVSADTKVAGKPFFDLVAEYLMPYQNAPKKVVKKKKEPEVAEGAKDQQIPTKVQKRSEWQKTPLSSNTIVVDGYTIRFTPDALIISKGGKVLWKKDGDYSRPTNSTLVSAKKLVTGLSRQGQPDEKQMFGKVDPEELKSRKDHRKKWQQASNLSYERKISFQQAWSQLFGDDVSESDSTVIAQTTKRLTDPKDGATAKLRAAGDKRREDQLKSRNIAKKNEAVDLKTSLQELSNDMLGKYKKAAGADAKKADAAGDFKRGDKRFKGINKATMKQFDNDAKKTK